MTPRLKNALKSGLLAYALTALTLALFASPLLANHFDFGHLHPDDAPTHVHTLSSVFTVGLGGSSLNHIPTSYYFLNVVLSKTQFVNRLMTHPVGSRAPPVAD